MDATITHRRKLYLKEVKVDKLLSNHKGIHLWDVDGV